MKNSIKHTPGPWGIDADGIQAGDFKKGFQPFGGCGCCDSPWMSAEEKERAQADADLICAAPQQHDALLAVRYSSAFKLLDDATKNAVIAALIVVDGVEDEA